MKLSVWTRGENDVLPAGVNIFGERLGATDCRVIEDEDTGHLFVALDEAKTMAAAKAVAAARGTSAESAVRDLVRALAPSVNGPTCDAWLAAVGYTAFEREQMFGLRVE